MSQSLRDSETLEILTIEALSGVDAQGKPIYAQGVEVIGRAVREDDVVRGTTSTGATGEEVTTMVTAWIDAGEDLLPEHGARITTEEGLVGIVVHRKDARNIQHGTLDHVRVKLRQE
jgi:hypothetical protein